MKAQSRNTMTRASGFSLIELMIVIAIIGILTTIAMGFYADNVIASNRTEARGALTTAAGRLEKCKSLYGTYTNASCNVTLPFVSDTNYYTISAAALTGTTFTLLATPVAGQPQANDTDCTTLSLTNTGVKTATGASPPDCW